MNTLICLLIAVLFSAFFSGMEIAFVSVDKLRLEMDRKPGITSSILSHFFRHSSNFISTMLVGNNIALVIYGILMAQILDKYILGDIGNEFVVLFLQTVISTLIIIVTGEFLPKTFFKMNPILMLRIFAIPLYILYIILYPISKFASMLSYVLLRMFGQKVNRDVEEKAFGKVDLDYFVSSSIENAENEDNLGAEVKIFQNVLDFSSVKLRDCMVPRTEILALDVKTPVEELISTFIESGNSRIIVFDGNIDNILGYIHSAEMFRNRNNWIKSIKTMPIVPETMSAQRLMKKFIKDKQNMAVVVDEFGGTSGIITLEDLVEEIFGEIEDEHDNSNYVCKKVGDNEYVLSGRLEIERVNELFDLGLPESDDYLTIGGLILDRYQSFPKLHETVEIDKYSFKIIKVAATKIELVRLKVNE
ncbi:MAG: HlyC/CorC family transporter [Bacteroidaceae bacterium]|jgi:CBS domain containing-hemolysin-like protein|nr:HlyC/CorC family transporter [Bacteroidaceae bacterium]MBP3832582.1 HlyC/CorC family transporter [Bacteroidaceae bacterium]